MKKIIIIIAVLLANNTYSQEKGTVDFGAGVGFISSTLIREGFNDVANDLLVSTITVGKNKIESRSNRHIPAINATFKYALQDDMFLNFDAVYEYMLDDLYQNDKFIGQKSNSFYILGVGTEYHFLNRELLQLYAGAGVAYGYKTSTVDHKTTDNSQFKLQLNLFGLRVGKKIAGTLELGYGYKGIINVGLSYQP